MNSNRVKEKPIGSHTIVVPTHALRDDTVPGSHRPLFLCPALPVSGVPKHCQPQPSPSAASLWNVAAHDGCKLYAMLGLTIEYVATLLRAQQWLYSGFMSET